MLTSPIISREHIKYLIEIFSNITAIILFREYIKYLSNDIFKRTYQILNNNLFKRACKIPQQKSFQESKHMKHLCSWRNIWSPPSSNLLQLQGGHPGKDSQNLLRSDFVLLLLRYRGDNLTPYCSEQWTQMCRLIIALYFVDRARTHTQPLKGGKLSSRLVIISFTLV